MRINQAISNTAGSQTHQKEPEWKELIELIFLVKRLSKSKGYSIKVDHSDIYLLLV